MMRGVGEGFNIDSGQSTAQLLAANFYWGWHNDPRLRCVADYFATIFNLNIKQAGLLEW